MAKHSDRITQVTYTLASATTRGLVGIDAQTFAGAKTLQDKLKVGTSVAASATSEMLEISDTADSRTYAFGLEVNTGTDLHLRDTIGGTRLLLDYQGNFDFQNGAITTGGLLTASNADIGGASGSFSVDIQASAYATLAFKDATNATEGYVQYEYSSDRMYFGANSLADSSVKMTLDGATKRLGIGANIPSNKLDLEDAGTVQIDINSTDSGRKSLSFQNNGTQVMGIGVFNDGMNIYGNAFSGAQNFMTVSNGGDVGIGTSTPLYPLHVFKQGTRGNFRAGNLSIGSSGGGYTHIGYNVRRTATTNVWEYDIADKSSFIHFDVGGIKFLTSDNVTGGAGNTISVQTAYYITSTGYSKFYDFTGSTNDCSITVFKNNSSAFSRYIEFQRDGENVVDRIRRNGTNNIMEFESSSDRRLKENITDMPPMLDKLCSIELKQFDFKDGSAKGQQGPIAQQLAEVFPEKINQVDDGVRELQEGDEHWTVGSRWEWEIVKAIQELNEKVEALTNG